MAEILHPFLSNVKQILRGNINQYFFKKERFHLSFLLWPSAILKLDFLKSPGKSGSARPLYGMKLGNTVAPLPHQ